MMKQAIGGTIACLFGLAIAFTQTTASAQDAYPSQPVKVISAGGPGSITDVVARIVANALSQAYGGKPVVVENKTGASQAVAAVAVANSKPDGYTLLIGASVLAINPAINNNVGYDLEKDLSPISEIAFGPYIVAINPSIPANNMEELAAYMKRAPSKLKWSTSLIGGGDHFATELFKSRAGVDVLLIPYNDSPKAIGAVGTGEVDATAGPAATVKGLAAGGKMKMIAVTGKDRMASNPEIKTVAESGFPGYDIGTWLGLWGPRGMSPELVKSLNEAVVRGLKLPEIQRSFTQAETSVVASSPPDFAKFVSSELALYRKIAADANIKP